jgi:prepilin-type processing-associated H-X9-DG protein
MNLVRRGNYVEGGKLFMTTNPYESPEHRSDLPQQETEWLASAVRLVVLLGVLGMLLLSVFPRRFLSFGSREAARRASCSNNLRNIALALHNYESTYGRLPPAYTVDASGNQLHSWRTLILPFMEQKALYDQIDLAKPWDDPANQRARNTPLRLYECPSNTAGRLMTTYFAVAAPSGCFKPTESISFADVKDRRDRTLMLIEISEKHAVHWMSPQDATEEMILNRGTDFDLSHPNGSQAAFVDGHIEYLTENVRPDVLRALISIAGNDDDIAADHP